MQRIGAQTQVSAPISLTFIAELRLRSAAEQLPNSVNDLPKSKKLNKICSLQSVKNNCEFAQLNLANLKGTLGVNDLLYCCI